LPWVKNYTALLSDPDYLELTDTQRGVLHGLWLLYGIRRRALEWSSRYLGRALSIPSQNLGRTLGVLERRNFIELCDATFTEERRGEEIRRDKKTPPISPSRGDEFDSTFLEFWKLYPRQRRGNKQKSHQAWLKALGRSSSGEIITGLHDYLASNEVRDGYAKGAAAWLNDDRWKSDYRTFRTKTADELREEFIHGDQGNDLGNGAIDGECVELSGDGFEGDGWGVPRSSEGVVRRPSQDGGNGIAQQLEQGESAEASGHHHDSERNQATLQKIAAIAAKRAKP
jgi:hypothetical protein